MISVAWFPVGITVGAIAMLFFIAALLVNENLP